MKLRAGKSKELSCANRKFQQSLFLNTFLKNSFSSKGKLESKNEFSYFKYKLRADVKGNVIAKTDTAILCFILVNVSRSPTLPLQNTLHHLRIKGLQQDKEFSIKFLKQWKQLYS